jgi:hypothetical protein
MHLVESQWLKRFCLHLCPRVVFPFKKKISKEILEKTKQLYVVPTLAYYYYVITSLICECQKGL